MYTNGIAICGIDEKFIINDFNFHMIEWQSNHEVDFIVNADVAVPTDVEDEVAYLDKHIEEINDNNYVLSSIRNEIVFSIIF